MTPVKKGLRLGWIAALGLFILTACSGGSDRDAKSAASALINENENIVAFGHISVQQLLDKTDYTKLPKAGALLQSELPAWQRSLDLSKPVYFAVEAPFSEDGSPAMTYALVNIKNKDSLMDKFSEMGYSMEKSGDIDCFRQGDLVVGLRGNLALLLVKGGEYDYKKQLETSFGQTEGSESEGKTAKILATKGDLVTGANLERLYKTSNTSLAQLSDAKKKELEALVADGFVCSAVHFEKGRMIAKTEHLFSDELKDRLFFKGDQNGTVLQKLGSGNAWMGISGNMDMRKMEAFMNDFAPEAQQKAIQALPGGVGLAVAMVGEDPLTKLFSGQFGLVMTGDPASRNGMLPQFNFFLGLGSKGDFIIEKVSSYAELMQLEKRGDAYVSEGVVLAPRKDGIYGYTTLGQQSGPLNVPSFARNFGKSTFSMFVNFGQIDVKSLELEDNAKVVEIMDTFVIDLNRDGSEMVLTSKDQSKNILKLVGEFYVRLAEEKMEGLSM